MLMLWAIAGGIVSGGSEQPLHCFLQGVSCGSAQVLTKGTTQLSQTDAWHQCFMHN